MMNGHPARRAYPHGARDQSSGQALVELAMTIPLFFLVLMGTAELARTLYVLIEVTNAAEAAVRYGAQNSTTANDVTGIQAAAQKDAANITLDTPSVVSTCGCADGSVSGASCTRFSCASGVAAVETLIVTTSETFDPLIHVPGLPASFTLYGRAQQRVLY
jgi:Flp pilus assembly protein TadG